MDETWLDKLIIWVWRIHVPYDAWTRRQVMRTLAGFAVLFLPLELAVLIGLASGLGRWLIAANFVGLELAYLAIGFRFDLDGLTPRPARTGTRAVQVLRGLLAIAGELILILVVMLVNGQVMGFVTLTRPSADFWSAYSAVALGDSAAELVNLWQAVKGSAR
ncbi:hypothetical protein ACFQ3L_04885 [Lacticaseibacillus jixianensis]|uniref:Uncharacterized protein n=1 Tax=Lacticaseibacillus jixianensis TaxID=2486012 RepID=A0ABW4B7B0_9LACO|nr:hypothetical protein [Lacticaseibacillus jixianensis]